MGKDHQVKVCNCKHDPFYIYMCYSSSVAAASNMQPLPLDTTQVLVLHECHVHFSDGVFKSNINLIFRPGNFGRKTMLFGKITKFVSSAYSLLLQAFGNYRSIEFGWQLVMGHSLSDGILIKLKLNFKRTRFCSFPLFISPHDLLGKSAPIMTFHFRFNIRGKLEGLFAAPPP